MKTFSEDALSTKTNSYIWKLFTILPLVILVISLVYGLAASLLVHLGYGLANTKEHITWTMKLDIVLLGYFTVLLLGKNWKNIRANKIELYGVTILLLLQIVFFITYISKNYWFPYGGFGAKALLIGNFILINLIVLRKKSLLDLFFSYTDQLLQFDFEAFYRRHKNSLVLLAISFVCIILAYGGKVFFISYATDDYARFAYTEPWWALASWLGRWANSTFNHFIFAGVAHIQPYLNTLVSLFCILLSAWLTSKIWQVKNSRLQFLIIGLIAISPYFAHNLYFNTNTAVFIGLLLAVLALYLLTRSIKWIPISIIMNTLAIGTYQTVLQVQLIILLIWFASQLQKQDYPLKRILLIFVGTGIFLLTSYILSGIVNNFIISYKLLHISGRLEVVRQTEVLDILKNAWYIVQRPVSTHLPNSKIVLLIYFCSYLLLGLSLLHFFNRSFLLGLAFVLIVLALRLVVDLPKILGVRVPIRAYFHVGWVLAGFTFLVQSSRHRSLAFFAKSSAALLIVVSTIYISHFYDAAHRQTQSDILRVQQIVNRIRMVPEYQSELEAVPFFIIGKNNFLVKGWKSFQASLNTNWSKYTVFKHFSDFHFRQLNGEEIKKVIEVLKTKQGIRNYPDKDSILFVDGVFVLVLDKDAIEHE